MDNIKALLNDGVTKVLDYGLSAAAPCLLNLTPWVDVDWVLLAVAGLTGRLVGNYTISQRG